MAETDTHPNQSADLRPEVEQIAREAAAQSPANLSTIANGNSGDTLPPDVTIIQDLPTMDAMNHELRVHQIELEVQNEELRRVQMELDTSRAKYFGLYDLAPVGYITVSEQGLILEANLTATNLFEVTRNMLIRQPILHFIVNEDRRIYFGQLEKLFDTHVPQTCELRMVRKHSPVFWAHMEITTEQSIDGAPVYHVVYFDITERKQAENAVTASEAKYRALVEATDTGYLILDEEGCVIDANAEYVRLAGHHALSDILGKSVIAWTANYEKQKNEAAVAQCRKDGFIRNAHIDYVDGRGRITPVEINATVIKNGELVQIISLVRDITAEKQAEDELAAEKQALEAANAELVKHRDHLEELVQARTQELVYARDKAESADRAKSAFLANMSHELHTPLHQIMGFGQLLALAVKDERASGLLVKLQSSSRQLLGLLDDILDYSKIDSGEIKIESVYFSLSTLLDQSEKEAREAATAKGLLLVREVDPGLPALMKGDQGRIGQILDNLLSNAVKFSEQGRITFGVRKVETPLKNKALRFEVEDQGIGITPELQTGLFELFNQGDNSLTRKYGGTGLGLALCKRLTALMGGEIGINSTPSEGSTFWFSIPLTIGEAPATDTVETGPVDWSQVAAAVDALDKLLANSDGHAKTLWKKSRHLVGAVLHDQLTEFEEAIQGYHFETALMLLREAVAAVPELSINEQTGVT